MFFEEQGHLRNKKGERITLEDEIKSFKEKFGSKKIKASVGPPMQDANLNF